jgi:hypothetical protein
MADTTTHDQSTLSLVTETTTVMSDTDVNESTATASTPGGKSFLMGLPLEMRHKIFGFAAQRPHGPYLILKEYLEKKDPDIGPPVQPGPNNGDEGSENGESAEEDSEGEEEEVEDEEEEAEGEEENGEDEGEGIGGEGEHENGVDDVDGEDAEPHQDEHMDDVNPDDTIQLSSGVIEITTSTIAPQPANIIIPAASSDEMEVVDIGLDDPIDEDENDEVTMGVEDDEGGSEEAEEEEEEDDGIATTIPPPGGFVPLPPMPPTNAAIAGAAPIHAAGLVPAPRQRPPIRYFGRDNKYRHVLPIIQLSHVPPPLGLLQTSKQLHEEALNYHLSTCIFEIDVTRSFMHQSIFEETLDKFVTNSFSPLEQIRKVSLVFSWDTEWLTNKTSGADPELFGDWAFTYGLQDRAEKVKELIRACPDLRKLTIDWHDSERTPKSEALMNETVMGFLDLTSKQWSDNITRESGFLDVTATEHFTESDTLHGPDSVIGRRRKEFDDILALIKMGREPFR